MKIRNFIKLFIFQSLWFVLLQSTAFAQNVSCDAATLKDFFDCYGGQNKFSTHSVAAVTAFVTADDALQAKNYAQAKTIIDNVFKTYPKGNNIWWNVFNAPSGANIGTPHAYYGLRMMEDIIDYGLNGVPNVPAKTAKMKIVLVGGSEGIQPNTEADLQNGTGSFVTHKIDASLKANDYRIIKQSFDLFSRYVTAITKGALKIDVEYIELDSLRLPVAVTTSQPHLAYSGVEPVWNNLTQAVRDSTDWWWILYPSHVPELPTFNDEAFITGGMGADSKGGPVFIIDDKWLVRKPAHLGVGQYSDIERRIYLPQWLQHEFFHHLYRIYPEFALEVKGHDWFNQSFWPSDFKGQFETDYYAETLHKRLQTACTPLATRLITRVQNDLKTQYSTFSMDELLGTYALEVVQNPWHKGDIIKKNGAYFWKNTANVEWSVTPNFLKGILETGSDCPYAKENFGIELYQTTAGDYVPGAVALKFNNELYKKRFDLIRKTVPIEITLGNYQRVPKLNTQHTGQILKTAGKFSWQNDAGNKWSLSPNAVNENFGLGADSPTPKEKFQLELIKTKCDIHALGFKYLGHYYWKPKRMASNKAPIAVNGLADLKLTENFGTQAINLADVFKDSEGDSLLLFVTSEDSTLISANIKAQQLLLSGSGKTGSTAIFVMALDANGGLAVDEFKVQVNAIVSTDEALSKIAVYPRLTHDFVYVDGANLNYDVTLYAVDHSYRQHIPVSGDHLSIDVGHLPAGIYFLLLTDPKNGRTKVEKIIKY